MFNILWIEDESDKIGGLVRPLKKDGNTIIVAKDKIEALTILTSNQKIDLIILDIIIPQGVSEPFAEYVGCDVLRNIREELNLTTPVIVLTVVDDDEILSSILKLNVSKILRKGAYLPSHLKEEVYSVLGYNQL
ncbi:hypothetical protein DOJK_01603 [Patescibacteria group bacterium]|uniref:response regulator n=1 Tax=Geobacter sp. TaxID=46610 RepID=UPI001AC4729D|nr:response regulator [Geobacter sp.]CAG1022329.1 hypothetical protein DOJK_01603 [Patescibacteria group bacterium]